MHAFTSYRLVERVLAHGDTKSSVLLWGGIQADLRLVPRESLGAALQYFTGSKAHNIALRDRALQRGLKLNEYGLFPAGDGPAIAGASEEDIYAALGLDVVPPELRENRGELAAAERHELPRLVTHADLRGDLHMHTTATDGRADAATMAQVARAAGLSHRDHRSQSGARHGQRARRACRFAHAQHVRGLNGRVEGLTLLAGIECDIRADGTMDLADDCLAQLDIVIASIHSAFNQDESQMTDRLLRAIACPWVDIIAHPTGRLIMRRDGYRITLDQILQAAASAGVALEINGQPDRLDLDEHHARLARDRGVKLVVDSDAHSPTALGQLRWSLVVARRAWLTADDVLNTLPLDAFKAALRRNRNGARS
jgi:DNA polymerase (family 10)